MRYNFKNVWVKEKKMIVFIIILNILFTIFIPTNKSSMNIIVTGAGKGIGNELVKVLSRHKGNSIVAISRNSESLKRLQAECSRINPDNKLLTIEFDLSQFEFYPFLVQKIEGLMRRCDVLVNNAGKLINRKVEDTTLTDFDDVYNVNVKSVFFLTQALLPLMGKNTHILNISSMGGFQGSKKYGGLSVYSSSKGALTVLTESMAEEFREKEIFVNCLALGSVQTEMFEKAFPGAKALQNTTSIAQYIADFATTGHKFYNGKVLPVSAATP